MLKLLDPQDVAQALRDGRLGILPTDTVPGFHCLTTAEAAIARIRTIKGRQAEKPLLMLCADPESALSLTPAPSPRLRAYANRCWPGPFTLVLPAGGRVPEAAVSPQGTVAVRVPDFPWLLEILQRVAGPLVSTSLNAAGAEPLTGLAEAEKVYGRQVDFLAPGPPAADRSLTGPAVASALLDLCVWPPLEIRSGRGPAPAWLDL